MMKVRNLIILGIVIVILGAGYFAATKLLNKETEKPPEVDNTKISITSLDEKQIAFIEITNDQGHFIYQKVEEEVTNADGVKRVDEKWIAKKPQDLVVRSSAIDSIAYYGASLSADKIIEEDAKDIAIYGLDNPNRFLLTMKDGTKSEILIGKLTPTKDGYYVKRADSNTVYTIGEYSGEKLLADKFGLMDTRIYGEQDYTFEDVKTLSLIRKGEKVFDATSIGNYQWAISYPIKWNADSEDLGKMSELLAALSVSEYIEDNVSDMSKYGLKNPKYEILYSIGDSEYNLILGDKTTDGKEIYATIGKDIVFTLPVESFGYLDKPVEDIFDAFVFLVNISDVSKLVVSFDGHTDISEIQCELEKPEEDVFVFNGKQIISDNNEKLFKKYYQGIIGITIDKIDTTAKPSGKPEIVIDYTLEIDPFKMKIELIPTEDGYGYYAMKNGEYVGVIVSRKVIEDKEYGLKIGYKNLVEALGL